jgi:hypothetical protein
MESLRKAWRDQPLLVGCGCALLAMLVFCGAGGLLLAVGWEAAGSKISEASGVDSIFGTSRDLAAAGFTFGAHTSTGRGTEYTLMPVPAREVTCEELKAALQPHLVGSLATVVIVSQSTVGAGEDGAGTSVPVRCTWEGGAAAAPEPVPAQESSDPPSRP